ncbi:MAG: Ni/Fe hydrogenase subunit alpha [Thermoleophilia bacterium]|nr:Ni/Fe hydrogenase subunit alpha [Thermoleophilia bacterium]
MKIILEHVTRIEGHASLSVMLADGRVHSARLKYEEGARLFEGILRGRKYFDAPTITSRICGVCPSVHNITAIRAMEGILGIQVDPVTEKLRRLMILAQWIQSHSLHAFFLALPDYLGAESAITMARDNPEEVASALILKKLGNDMVYAIGGRAVHPITTMIGGFSNLPPASRLANMRQRLQAALPEATRLARLTGSLDVPDFSRQTTYLALQRPDEYAYYDGDVCSTEGYCSTPDDFCSTLREEIKPNMAAKAGLHEGKGFFTGALARVNLSSELLDETAGSILADSGHAFPSNNTFLNTFCQTVELVHALMLSIKLINELLAGELEEGKTAVGAMEVNVAGEAGVKIAAIEPRAGTGVAATEAPRGTLYHSYTIDGEGLITDDNIITPTAQNLTNIEDDIDRFVDERRDWEPTDLIQGIERLVRAYDPCVSCATH